jgi:putative salt-induced outer membrane protein
MKRSYTIVGVVLMLGLVYSLVQAEEGQWSGETELGFVVTSGNTETQTLNLKAGLGYQKSKWSHALNFSALSTKDDGGTRQGPKTGKTCIDTKR